MIFPCEHTFESSERATTIKSVLAPPQDTAADEVGIRSCSSAELARRWVEALQGNGDEKPLLAEFNRRYWLEQEEAEATGGPLRLFPAFRQLGSPPPRDELETCGVVWHD